MFLLLLPLPKDIVLQFVILNLLSLSLSLFLCFLILSLVTEE